MHSEATRSLYGMVERLTALGRSQVFGDPETISVMAPLNLLFEEKWSSGETMVRMTDVSRRLMISKPGATQAVNRLVERGLMERASDENDRRVVYIRATQAGRDYYEREIERTLSMVDRVVACMGEENANQLVIQLERFFNAFDELGISSRLPACAPDPVAAVEPPKPVRRADEITEG